MRVLLKVSQHMPHLSENEKLMLANGQLRRYSQEAIDAAGPKAVGDGGPKARRPYCNSSSVLVVVDLVIALQSRGIGLMPGARAVTVTIPKIGQ